MHIVRNNWTVIPTPAEVTTTEHQLARACKKYKGIIFTDKDGMMTMTLNVNI